jgi:hypothetical protein
MRALSGGKTTGSFGGGLNIFFQNGSEAEKLPGLS